jgi:hypothetical protein
LKFTENFGPFDAAAGTKGAASRNLVRSRLDQVINTDHAPAELARTNDRTPAEMGFITHRLPIDRSSTTNCARADGIRKGKAHTPYEFGVKVSVAAT